MSSPCATSCRGDRRGGGAAAWWWTARRTPSGRTHCSSEAIHEPAAPRRSALPRAVRRSVARARQDTAVRHNCSLGSTAGWPLTMCARAFVPHSSRRLPAGEVILHHAAASQRVTTSAKSSYDDRDTPPRTRSACSTRPYVCECASKARGRSPSSKQGDRAVRPLPTFRSTLSCCGIRHHILGKRRANRLNGGAGGARGRAARRPARERAR